MPKRSLTREWVVGLLCVCAPLCLWPLGWWLAYQPYLAVSRAATLVLYLAIACFALALFAAPVLVVGPVMTLFRGRRSEWPVRTAAAATILAATAGGIAIGQGVWRNGVNRVVANGDPLVAAIGRYEAANGRPPAALDDLVPVYLPAVPETGIGEWPDFRYVVGKPERYDGNPWVLTVTPPNLPMGFDVILYFPRQNYPANGYGGSIERVGGWGYVHE